MSKWEPAWKSLVRTLQDREFQSTYLDRLAQRIDIYNGGEGSSLEQEILAEMAFALGRAEDKINHALLELEVVAAEIEAETDPLVIAELTDHFNEVRERAMRAKWEFMIHREALGMIRHEVLDELYPVPKPR